MNFVLAIGLGSAEIEFSTRGLPSGMGDQMSDCDSGLWLAHNLVSRVIETFEDLDLFELRHKVFGQTVQRK